jgi:hypothetical protein
VNPRALRSTVSATDAFLVGFADAGTGVAVAAEEDLLVTRRGVKGSASALNLFADSTSRNNGGAKVLRI